jgi:hypothetical protein
MQLSYLAVPVIISLQAGQHGFAWDSVVSFLGIEVGTGDRKGDK